MTDGIVSRIVEGRPGLVYPLILALDGEFGREVGEAIAAMPVHEVESQALRTARLEEVADALKVVRGPRLEQSILPTKVAGPEWVAIICDASNDALVRVEKWLNGSRGGVNCFVALLLNEKEADTETVLAKAREFEHSGNITFLLSTKADDSHNRADLAAGFASFLLESWRRYQRQGEAYSQNIRHSLNIDHVATSLFTIGIGRMAPDPKYHAQRYVEGIEKAVWGELSVDSSPCEIPEPCIARGEEIAEVGRLLPENAFLLDSRTAHGRLRLGAGGESLGVSAMARPRLKSRTLEFSRLPSYMHWLREVDDFYQQVDMPASQRLIGTSAEAWDAALLTDREKALALPEDARGIFWYYEQVFSKWEELWSKIASLEVECRAASRLQEDLGRIRRKADKVPAPGGIVLRSLLVAIVLGWLFIGSHLWGGGIRLWQDTYLRTVALLCTFGFLFIPGGGLFAYMLSMKRCFEAIQNARRNTYRRYVAGVLEFLRSRVVRIAGNALDQLQEQRQGFHQLRSKMANRKEGGSATAPENNAPAFGEGCLDGVIADNLATAETRVLTRVPDALRSRVQSSEGSKDLWCHEFWTEALGTVAREEAEEAVRTLDFAAAADAAEIRASHCIRLVLSSVMHPALPRLRQAPQAVAFLFAPATWNWQNDDDRKRLLGAFDRTVVVPSEGRRDLLAVAPIPVTAFNGTISQEDQ